MIDTPISWPGAFLAAAAALAIPSPATHWPEPGAHAGADGGHAESGHLAAAAAVSGHAESGHLAAAAAKGSPVEDHADELRIRRQTVCVGSRHWSAGEVGDTILYRARRVGNKLSVGYFVHWSTERPWGNNVLSYTFVPALATDAVYSHFMFVLPGMKDFLYGPDDIEGARVDFEQRADGSLEVIGGAAEDGTHGSVELSPRDLVDSKGRVVLVTDVWSHQLGSHDGGKFADQSEEDLHCYGMPAVRRLTEDVARAFRLGDEQKPLRGRPAWSAVTTAAGTLTASAR